MLRSRLLLGVRRGSPVGPAGVVLVITLLLVGLLFLMGSTLINLSFSDYQIANNESQSIQALYNADAGTEEAKMRLSPTAPSTVRIPVINLASWRAYIYSGTITSPTQAEMQAAAQSLDPTFGLAPPNYTSTEDTSNYVYYNTVQSGSNAIPWGWARIQHKVDSSGNILYQNTLSGQGTNVASEVTNATGNDSYGNTVANEAILVVTAEGIKGPVRRMIAMEFLPVVPTTTTTTPVTTTTTTTTTTTVVTDPYSNAAHGKSSVGFIGNMYTDSYDSRLGVYNVSSNKGSNGDISTDATTAGAISLGPNTAVNGDVMVGPGVSDPSTVITGSGTITGTTTAETSAWEIPLSTIPTGVSNSGALSLSGNNVTTLSAGTYWFRSISITGNAQLRTTGAVKIYVTGSIDIGGNGVATAGNTPPNLLIYGTVDPNNSANKCTSVSVHGNGDFYGAIYAPAATIAASGNGSVFGALTGNMVTFNGSGYGGLHYDEALGKLGETTNTYTTTTSSSTTTTVTTATYSFTGYSRYSWREIAF